MLRKKFQLISFLIQLKFLRASQIFSTQAIVSANFSHNSLNGKVT